jgi:hypothetical protein
MAILYTDIAEKNKNIGLANYVDGTILNAPLTISTPLYTIAAAGDIVADNYIVLFDLKTGQCPVVPMCSVCWEAFASTVDITCSVGVLAEDGTFTTMGQVQFGQSTTEGKLFSQKRANIGSDLGMSKPNGKLALKITSAGAGNTFTAGKKVQFTIVTRNQV